METHVSPEQEATVAWQSYRDQVGLCAPGLQRHLGKAATDQQLNRVETVTGRALPAIARAVYRIHDGTGDLPRAVGSTPLLSLGSALSEYERLAKGASWRRHLLPVHDYGTGDYFCIDLNDENGRVVEFDHEEQDELSVEANDLARYLIDFSVDWLSDLHHELLARGDV